MNFKNILCSWSLLFLIACDSSHPPLRIDFEHNADLDKFHWKCRTLFSLSNKHATSGKKSLQIEFFPSEYPGILFNQFDPDWSGYNEFRIDLHNPNDFPVILNIRIDDKNKTTYADRYNEQKELMPGSNILKIKTTELITSDRTRSLNIKNIKQVLLFTVKPTKKILFYMDNIRLK